VLDDGKIYRSEDPLKSSRIKQLFADAPDILGFWTDHFHECLDGEVKEAVKEILADAQSSGLTASHLSCLKGYATISNFIDDGSLDDGVNFVG